MSSADEITAEAKKNISRIQLSLLHEENRERRQSLLDELFEEEQRLSPVRRANGPFGSARARARPKPIQLRGLQVSLRADEMLLEYVLDEPESFCLRITRTNAQVVTLPVGRKRIEGLVDNYLSNVKTRQSESRPGRELFSALLQPVIDRESTKRLIIVPDGMLHLLPFDALRDRQGKYVLESHTVSYAPSATVLYLLRNSHSSHPATMSFLGVGGVLYSNAPIVPPKSNGSTALTSDLFDLKAVAIPNLPGSRQEVVSLAGIVRGHNQLLLSSNATEAAFRALPLADFRIIHLAVHGVASARFPNRAALLLGVTPAGGDDGLLQVREIEDLPLNADLVTLSACDTGQGRLLGQEGMASLERSFLVAGAKAVIASIWKADDTYTIALMKQLYEHLVDGEDKATALRHAKIDLLRTFGEQALPVYWAGFILVGDGSAPIFK